MEMTEIIKASEDLFYDTEWAVSFNFGSEKVQFKRDTRSNIAGKDCAHSIKYDGKRDVMIVSITEVEDNNLLSEMSYTHRSVRFSGRDRTTRSGIAQLIPQNNQTEWGYYGRPAYCKKQLQKDTLKEIVPIIYREQTEAVYDFKDAYGPKPEATSTTTPAIAIVGCDRLDYWTEVVQALAQNPQFSEWDVFAFIDKPKDKSLYHLTKEQGDLLQKVRPGANVIYRDSNLGCGRNIIDVRRQLFDDLKYERVYVFEDDLVPSSNYLTYCENLWKWTEGLYDNVGVVQGWGWCEYSPEARRKYLNYVRSTCSNWWGYSISRMCWNSIKDMMYDYEKNFLFGKEYASRPHKTILSWLRDITDQSPEDMWERPYPDQFDYRQQSRKYFDGPPTGQDGVTMILTWFMGWRRLAPVVNRAKYIGKRGIHMNPGMWKYHGYDNILFEEYPSDSELTEFVEQITALEDPALQADGSIPGLKRVVLA